MGFETTGVKCSLTSRLVWRATGPQWSGTCPPPPSRAGVSPVIIFGDTDHHDTSSDFMSLGYYFVKEEARPGLGSGRLPGQLCGRGQEPCFMGL